MGLNQSDSRRGFLRGLTTLPLVGGGVTLIGAPSAVAEPVTTALLHGYAEWLLLERRVLMWELLPDRPDLREYARPDNRITERFHIPGYPRSWQDMPKPSTRAALVLSTVGAEWRGDQRCA